MTYATTSAGSRSIWTTTPYGPHTQPRDRYRQLDEMRGCVMATPYVVSRRYKPSPPDQQAVEIAEADRHLDQLTTDVAPCIRRAVGVGPDTTAETLVEAALQHERLEGDMLNHLIFFDTPQTTADQRRAPQSRADGAATCRRVAPNAAHTDRTTSCEDGDHYDVGDADRARHQSDAAQDPPERRLSPFQRDGGHDLRCGHSDAARHWTRAIEMTSSIGWKGTLTHYRHDK
jgi:hypothetical protein